MITFKEFLAEIADSGSEFKVRKALDDVYAAEQMISGRKVFFTAREEDEGHWYITFSEISGGTVKQGKTGAGGEFKVAGFVSHALKDVMKRYDPKVILFTAEIEEENDPRPDVYEKLVRRLLPNFTLKRRLGSGGSTVYFALTRNN